MEEIRSRQQAIEEALEDEDAELSDDDARALNDEHDRLEAESSEIEQSLLVFAPDAIAVARAVITLGHQGEIVVHRGLVREADSKALCALEGVSGASGGEGGAESQGVRLPCAVVRGFAHPSGAAAKG